MKYTLSLLAAGLDSEISLASASKVQDRERRYEPKRHSSGNFIGSYTVASKEKL